MDINKISRSAYTWVTGYQLIEKLIGDNCVTVGKGIPQRYLGNLKSGVVERSKMEASYCLHRLNGHLQLSSIWLWIQCLI